jgi:fibronectin type 3 domain-containing protein
MFEYHPHLIAARGFMAAACLLLLAGCGGGDNTSSSSSSATSSSISSAASSSTSSATSSSSSSVTSSSSSSASSVPAVPTGVAATAGDTQISLTWTASSGATSYNVKRATASNGTYASVGTPITNSYNNTGLANGTPYFYVVSAVNAGGHSVDSTPVSATPVAPTPPPTTLGTWINVTPAGVNLSNVNLGSADCNYGARTVQADPVVPSNLYTLFDCQGVWKSTDYGATWSGPINTGTNGSSINGCSGGITISRSNSASAPTIYAGCIRGAGVGFWKSVDGGVSWTKYIVGVVQGREDYYAPVVDPYDDQHLLMGSHEFNPFTIVQSTNGGQSWSGVTLTSGMQGSYRSPTIFFVNTGNATSTRKTWLWLGDFGSGLGTWRTEDSGATWTKVDTNDYIGAAQLYQPNNNGAVFMAGSNGISRSTDYGQTWARVGSGTNESIVFGTSKNTYSMYGYPVGPNGSAAPSFQVASQPGTGTWVSPGTPGSMAQGPAQAAVVNNGTNSILVGAMWNSGLWRYVEP